MASVDYGQLSTVLQRLGKLGSLLNPLTLVPIVAGLIHEIARPPPGDPPELESLAGAFRTAAEVIEPIGDEVRAMSAQQLPAVGGGAAGDAAMRMMIATGDAVGATATACRDTATVLETLAGVVRELQRRHGALHRDLHDAYHEAIHVAGLRIPNPSGLQGLVRAVRELFVGAQEIHTDAITAADTAAVSFADITGRVRTGAGAVGGLDAAEAILLAEERIGIGGFGDGGAVLAPAQLTRAGRRLESMSLSERTRADDLLARAGSRTGRAYLLKALAAGHPGAALGGFAEKIRGREPSWLHSHLNLIDRTGPGIQQRFGAPVNQHDSTTCGTTSLIVSRAATDPLYALTFTEGIENLRGQERADEFKRRLRAEQIRVHDETNVLYPKFIGTSPRGMADWMNRHTGATGVSYGYQLVDDTDQRKISGALRDVVTVLERGHPVPILVGGAYPAHYVVAVGHQDGQLLVFEPTAGVTAPVTAVDFLTGHLGGAVGFDHVQAVIVPEF